MRGLASPSASPFDSTHVFFSSDLLGLVGRPWRFETICMHWAALSLYFTFV